MAAVPLFWDTNMAAMTSCKNILFVGRNTPHPSIKRLSSQPKNTVIFIERFKNATRLFSAKRMRSFGRKKSREFNFTSVLLNLIPGFSPTLETRLPFSLFLIDQ